MGRAALEGMLEVAEPDVALSWHLTSNHFPPIVDGVRFARLAITAVEEGRGDEFIIDEESERAAPHAWEVVDSWHLHDFVGMETA